jgi:CheY-like chemotaxis protein
LPSDVELYSAIVAASDWDWRNHLRQIATECGLEPLVSRTGHEAVDRARSVAASLVILGMLLPVKSAVRACEHIRDLPHYTTIPIIVCVPVDDLEMRRAAIQAGATALLEMPLSMFGLRQGILPLLGGSVDLPAPAAEWSRAQEPSRLFESKLLARGREILKIDRQSQSGPLSHRINWRCR